MIKLETKFWLILGVLVWGALFAIQNKAEAESSSWTTTANCDKKATSGACSIYGSLGFAITANGTYPFQTNRFDWNGHLDGHGGAGPSGGKGALNMCLSARGAMWDGICINIVDDRRVMPVSGMSFTNCNGCPGEVGDKNANYERSYTHPDNSYPAKYMIGEYYANDATWTGSATVSGRIVEAEITVYNPNMVVGGSQTISFAVEHDTDGSGLSWTGPINCVVSGSTADCTATGEGTAVLTLQARGPTGNGIETVEYEATITITNPGSPPGAFVITGTSCFNWPSPEIEVNHTVSSGAVSYTLYRSQDGGGWSPIFSGSYSAMDNFSDSALTTGSSYRYYVRATNSYGNYDSGVTSPLVVNSTNCGSSAPPPTPPPPPGPGTCSENASLTFLSSPPSSVLPGQTFSYSIRLANTGNVRYAHGTWWRLSDRGTDIYSRGGSVTPLPMQNTGAYWPGDYADHTITVTAPTTVGSYRVGMQMLHMFSVAGYDLVQNPDCPSGTGTDHYFGNQLFANFNVVDAGNIVVNSVHGVSGNPFPTSWVINGPGGWSATTTSQTTESYLGRPPGTYTITPSGAIGYNVSVSPPTPYNLSAGETLTWTLTYSPKTGDVSASASISTGSWQIRDSSGTVVNSGSGTTVRSFTLPEGNYRFTTVDLPSYDEFVRVNGGTSNQASPYSFNVTHPSSITLLAYYSLPAPAAPSNIRLEVSPCEQLRFSWIDNSGPPTEENGFRIWYRTSSGGPNNFIADVSGSAGTGTRLYYTWNPPAIQPYWIAIAAYKDYPPRVYSATTQSTSFTPQECRANLSPSLKEIFEVNGSPFISTRSGVDNDLLTYRIIIQNSGTENVTINNISDIFHPNPRDDGSTVQLVAPGSGLDEDEVGCENATGTWYLCVDKDADGNYNESGETATISGTAPNLTINISGTKCTTTNNNNCTSSTDPSCSVSPIKYCNNWVVLLSARVKVASPGIRTEVWNEAVINYREAGVLGSQRFLSPRYLINTPKPRVPDFREIAP